MGKGSGVFWRAMSWSRYCTGAALAASIIAIASPADAQQIEGPALFRVFLRGSPVGTEDVLVQRTPDGWIISGTGHLGAPLDLTTRRLEVRYDANWKPKEL